MNAHLRRSRRGFTLLEMIVAIAIIAILVGAAVPVTSKILTHKAKSATREELQLLSDACAEFFRDTGNLPVSIGELIVNPGDAGWSGPYLAGVVTDTVTGSSGYEVDAWSRGYQLAASGNVLTITSSGEDLTFGNATDLRIALDVTWIRRDQTAAELQLINQAVQRYNAVYQSSNPLSTSWPTALNSLVARGFLPAATDYQLDGWGQSYEADPPNKTPVVKIQSPSLVSALESLGGGSSGSGQGKDKGKGKGKGNNGNGNGGASGKGKKK
jgi:prepilin-type N-terminal cleavage/methylation domain-containing protein